MSAEEKEFQPNGKIWLLIILVLLAFSVSLLYFSRNNPDLIDSGQAQIDQSPAARTARIYTVYYNGGVFSPTNIRIHAGDSIKFQNDGDNPIHVSGDITDGIPDLVGFDSIGDIPPQSSFAFTFSEPGIFGYHNDLNKYEKATVIVRQQ